MPGLALRPGRQPSAAPAWQSEKYRTGPVDDAVTAAVALRAAVIETVQVAVPLHAPPHPVKLCPDDGVAVSVTLAPDAKLALHAVPLGTAAYALHDGVDQAGSKVKAAGPLLTGCPYLGTPLPGAQ